MCSYIRGVKEFNLKYKIESIGKLMGELKRKRIKRIYLPSAEKTFISVQKENNANEIIS